MKKALAILSALALVGGAAFADAGISVGGWGRIGFNPLVGSSAGGDAIATTDPSWANGARVGVNFAGHSDNIGFNLNIDANGPALAIGDQAKIWVKANDLLKLEFGKIQGDVLRGKFGDWGLFADYSAGGEDNIFARFYPKAGLLVNLTPAEGVYVGAALDAGEYAKTVTATVSGTTVTIADSYTKQTGKTADMFKKIQVGAGYTIANVGLVRAQYIGTADKDADGNAKIGKIGVAFNLTAVKGFNADIGATIDANKDATQNVTAAASYSLDALSVVARATLNLAKKTGLGVAAKVDYTVSGPLAVGASVGYANETDLSATGTIYGQPYVKLGYSNGYVAAGFKFANAGSTTTYALPIFAEYWF